MNKIWLVLVLTLIITVSPTVVYAQRVGRPNATEAAVRQEDRLKVKALTEIDRRLTALSKLANKINATDRLTADQKSTILSQIQTTVSNLTALKTKVEAGTDLVTLRADVQSISKNYQVYALVMPKAELMGAVNTVLAATDKMTELSSKLQTRINEAQAAGKDVTALQTAHTSMQNKIASAKNQAQTALTAVSSLTTELNPDNKSTLESARTALKAARQDLVSARQEAQIIINGLK